MTQKFSIDCKWLVDGTNAYIYINADGHNLTETTHRLNFKRSFCGDVLPIALWFVDNYENILLDKEDAESLDWQMSHHIASIGQGYLWPDLTFSNENGQIRITSKKTALLCNEIKYENECEVFISKQDFHNGIDQFIHNLIERMKTLGMDSEELQNSWQEKVLETC